MIGRLIGILDACEADSINVIVNRETALTATYLRSLTTKAPLRIVEKSTAGSFESFAELAGCLDPDSPFCLMTVDTVFRPEEFADFIAEFQADTQADGYMAVTAYVADEKPLYVADDGQGLITGFLDSPVPGIRYVSGGIYALRPAALAILDDCRQAGLTRMRDFQRALVAAGLRLKARPFGKIIDVDHVADLDEARRLIGGEPHNQ